MTVPFKRGGVVKGQQLRKKTFFILKKEVPTTNKLIKPEWGRGKAIKKKKKNGFLDNICTLRLEKNGPLYLDA